MKNEIINLNLKQFLKIIEKLSCIIKIDPFEMEKNNYKINWKNKFNIEIKFNKIKNIIFSKELSFENELNYNYGKIENLGDDYILYINSRIRNYENQKYVLSKLYILFILDILNKNNIVVENLNIDDIRFNNKNIEILSSNLLITNKTIEKYINSNKNNDEIIINLSKLLKLPIHIVETRIELYNKMNKNLD